MLQEICQKSNVEPQKIQKILVGTTQATNALLQNNDLLKVGVIRLATNCTQAIKPFSTWPQPLKTSINAGFAIVAGGYECDGSEISSINPQEIKQAVETLLKNGMQSLAIVGVFSPLNPAQEETTKKICEQILEPKFPISVSHEIGGINFLERENATIINSTLKQTMQHGFENLAATIKKLQFDCDLFITQNNGTVISLEHAIKYPVLTISSGPTNSFVGALHLTNKQNAIIVDIGGTSTDVGIALQGFARRSLHASTIAGISINFEMPDVISIAIGGGSYIEQRDHKIFVGPKSCAKNLTQESLIFGGNRMTLTDVAVTQKYAQIPHTIQQNPNVPENVAQQVMLYTTEKILELCAQMAGKHKNLPIILIGGGATLFAQSPFAQQVMIPEQAAIANALGAALAQASGTVDVVVALNENRNLILQNLEQQAIQKAVQSGAINAKIKIVERQLIPHSYSTNNLTRVKITAQGPLMH